MPYVDFKNTRVSYRVDGDGEPLILVHGTGGDAESNWSALVEPLSDEWKLIRPDYAGSGKTMDDGRPLTADDLVEQILAVADVAGASSFHLLGFSLGAALAARIAGDHPERVRSLILVNGFASSDETRLQLQFTLWRDLIRTDRPAMARLIMLTGFSPSALASFSAESLQQIIDTTVADTNWEGMARQVDLDLSINVTESVARIIAPTLVIGCSHDHMVPPGHARNLADTIVGARYMELPSGHLVPMEQPRALTEQVSAFLREQRKSLQ
ncbi:alpha/beta fold hydrolase [Kushneria aurantia]|uniref:Alpha/beta fold hydrolase n=1 Tax=Kushneria aurantia TaxID=504092 RepID=A0ABV6G0W3_9GAMM|nr:alpha/beta hydrolase [Kushneria aurantia]